jgi:hypothetical protein
LTARSRTRPSGAWWFCKYRIVFSISEPGGSLRVFVVWPSGPQRTSREQLGLPKPIEALSVGKGQPGAALRLLVRLPAIEISHRLSPLAAPRGRECLLRPWGARRPA